MELNIFGTNSPEGKLSNQKIKTSYFIIVSWLNVPVILSPGFSYQGFCSSISYQRVKEKTKVPERRRCKCMILNGISRLRICFRDLTKHFSS